ncbi:MAG TPA: hypothetical protein VHJ34_01690 [Actinomycetota bacterium]|nr:hypothetical protein [Actinomycetota bacterium]
MSRLRIVTLAGDADAEAALASELARREDVELVFRCVDRVELLGALRGGDLDAVVSVGAPPWLDAQSAAEAARSGTGVVGVVGDADAAERLAALGAALVPAGAPADEVVARCRVADVPEPRPLPSAQPSRPDGKLVAVWGPKGAPGRTSVAIELACELASDEPATILVDGDPYGGDVVQLLGVLDDLPTIVWAARLAARDELDPARLALDLRRAGERGPVLLPGLPRAELWPDVSEYGWGRLLTTMRAAFRVVVCDVGFCLEGDASPYPGAGDGRNRIARATIAAADRVVAVCGAGPTAIKTFLWSYPHVSQLADPDDVIVVANRVPPGSERDVGELVRRHTGKRPVAYVPDRPGDFARAVRDGVPVRAVAPHVGAALRPVVTALGGAPRSAGLLARLAGRT